MFSSGSLLSVHFHVAKWDDDFQSKSLPSLDIISLHHLQEMALEEIKAAIGVETWEVETWAVEAWAQVGFTMSHVPYRGPHSSQLLCFGKIPFFAGIFTKSSKIQEFYIESLNEESKTPKYYKTGKKKKCNKENVHLLSFICYQDSYASLLDRREKVKQQFRQFC